MNEKLRLIDRKWFPIIILVLLAFPLFGFINIAESANSEFNYSNGDIPLDDATYQEFLKPAVLDRAEVLPHAYDARDDGIVTPAKNQGSCGSCWAFSSVGALESHLLAAGLPFTPVDLSEQQLVSCYLNSSGCCGGSSYALRYWVYQGPVSESCFAYAESDTYCAMAERTVPCENSAACPQLNYRIANWHTVPENNFRESLWINGPSYFRYDVYSDFHTFWNNASSGDVYVQKSGEFQGGHAVLIIGWDDDKQAYLIKNSWGRNSGPEDNGTFWFAYDGHKENLGFQMTNFDVYSFNILKPNAWSHAYAGSASDPQKIIIHVNKPTPGLTKNAFAVTIGSQTAKIISAYELSENYVLEVLPNPVSNNGAYDLTVEYLGGSIADKIENAVVFAESSHVDVELVIDRSGTMSGEPLNLAKSAASQFVDFMNYGDMMGVVSFETAVTIDFPLTTIVETNPDVKTEVKNAIAGIVSGNNAAMGGALQTAQQQLTNLGNASHPWAMVLLTGGQENQSPPAATVLPDIVASKTEVHTVGLGSANQQQLFDIATQTGGTYNYASSVGELAEIYRRISGAVSNQQSLFNLTDTFDSNGFVREKPVFLDSTVSSAIFSVYWTNSAYSVDVNLQKPNGEIIDPASSENNPDIEWVSRATYQYFRIKQPALTPGVWKIKIVGKTDTLSPDDVGMFTGNQADTYTIKVTANTSLTAQLYLDKESYRTYEPIKLVASISDSEPIRGANVIATVIPPSASIRAGNESEWLLTEGDTTPNPQLLTDLEAQSLDAPTTLVLYDDGKHGDGAANDGVYANYYHAAFAPGTYSFSISVDCESTSGEAFTRQAYLSTYIAEAPNLYPPSHTYLPVIMHNTNPSEFTIQPVRTAPTDAGITRLQRNLTENTQYYWLAQYICWDNNLNQHRGLPSNIMTVTTGSDITIPPEPIFDCTGK